MTTTFDKKSKNVFFILMIIGLVAIIAGIVTSFVSKKDNVEDETKKKLEKTTTYLEAIGIPMFVLFAFAFFVIKAGEK